MQQELRKTSYQSLIVFFTTKQIHNGGAAKVVPLFKVAFNRKTIYKIFHYLTIV